MAAYDVPFANFIDLSDPGWHRDGFSEPALVGREIGEGAPSIGGGGVQYLDPFIPCSEPCRVIWEGRNA
jgi:hypothetical protein